VSVIAAPPDLNVTVGVDIASLAVSVRVTTSPSFATEVMALLVTMLTELSVGAVPSYVQLNCEAAELLLPTASVKAPAATSIVVAPDAVGVKVAVKTVDDEVAKLLNAPPEIVMSPTTKLLVASLDVKVRERVASLDVPPSLISAAVIAIVGAVVSNVTLPEPLVTAVPAFPAVSLKAML
jgi:hypothetical protein